MPGHLPTHLLPETVVKLHSAAAAAALALVLTGCSTVVEFASDIEGARVTSADGTTAGITPVQVTYDNDALDAARGADGCAAIAGVTYTWPSGAKATSANPIRLCGEQSTFRVHLERPKDAPGLETDLKNALTRAQQREAALKAALAREQAERDFYFMNRMMWAPMMMPPPPPPPPAPPRPPRR